MSWCGLHHTTPSFLHNQKNCIWKSGRNYEPKIRFKEAMTLYSKLFQNEKVLLCCKEVLIYVPVVKSLDLPLPHLCLNSGPQKTGQRGHCWRIPYALAKGLLAVPQTLLAHSTFLPRDIC
jgi:hypothetical protein